MAAQSQLSVCNLALLSVGARAQVSSIFPSDGSTAADACATLFSFVFQNLGRSTKWGCLNKQLSLTLIQAAQGTPENPTGTSLQLPQQPWLYAYLYPSDCLLLRDLSPALLTSGSAVNQTSLANNVTPWVYNDGDIPYETGLTTDSNGVPIEIILTNQENAIANYNVDQQNPALWDALFTAAFVASMGAYLVPALSLNPPLMQAQIAIAEKMIARAQQMDGNESPVVQDHVPDWIRARQGATGVLMGGVGYNAYGQMPWPVW